MSARTVMQALEMAIKDRFPGVAIEMEQPMPDRIYFVARRDGLQCVASVPLVYDVAHTLDGVAHYLEPDPSELRDYFP